MTKGKTGPASFGYERRGGRLVAHPQEAPIRRRIFELFAEHQRKKTVAEILNADGATTRSGGDFTGHTIGRLLDDERVVGVPRQVDRIVPKELYERCKAILAAQRTSGGARRRTVHLLSGFVFCQCGQTMYVPSNAKKYVCGDCRAKIPTNELEAVFCSQLASCRLPKDLSKTFTDLSHRWSSLPYDTRREIVECVLRRIEIGDKKVTCSLVPL